MPFGENENKEVQKQQQLQQQQEEEQQQQQCAILTDESITSTGGRDYVTNSDDNDDSDDDDNDNHNGQTSRSDDDDGSSNNDDESDNNNNSKSTAVTTGGSATTTNNVTKQRKSTRTGSILLVRTQSDSITDDKEIHQRLVKSARERRKSRFEQHGIQVDNVKDHKASFRDVTIRKYPMVLGDNPGGMTDGPPLQIDWKFYKEKRRDVNEFEKLRSSRRRHALELLIHPTERKKILKRSGFALDDIEIELSKVRQARSQRTSTMRLQANGVEKAREVYENASRKFVHVLTFGQSKRKEKKFLAQYANGSETTAPSSSGASAAQNAPSSTTNMSSPKSASGLKSSTAALIDKIPRRKSAFAA